MDKLQTSLKSYLNYESTQRVELKKFIQELQELGEVAIFGGMIRDFVLDGARKFQSSSDIDLVVSSESLEDLLSVCKSKTITLNRLGGIRIDLEKWRIDLWLTKDTWAFKQDLGLEPTIENLPLTTFFSLDSICYNITQNKVICSSDYFKNVQLKNLDCVSKNFPSMLYVLKKAYRYIVSLGFQPSPEMKMRLVTTFDNYINQGQPNLGIEHIHFYSDMKKHLENSPLSNFDYSKQLSLLKY